MICRLCLLNCEQFKKIFDSKENELNIATVIRIFPFTFQIQPDDQVSTSICNSCWKHIQDFHKFYCDIEQAQKQLTKGILVEKELLSSSRKDDDNKKNNTYSEQENNIETVSFEEINVNTIKTEFEDSSTDDDGERSNRSSDGALKKNTKQLPTKRIKSQKVDTESDDSKEEASNDSKSIEEIKKSRNRKKSISEYTKKCREIAENIAQKMMMHCELCSKEFCTFAELKTHFRQIHKCIGYVRCCDKKFKSPGYLWEHIQHHSNPECVRCEICEKTFIDRKGLRLHQNAQHAPEEQRKFKCDKCSKSFVKEYMLDKHKLVHVPKEEMKFSCDTCGKVFAAERNLKYHTKRVHELAYGLMCDICGRLCHDKGKLDHHHATYHSNVTGPKVQCPECGAWIRDKKCLQYHMLRHKKRREDLANPEGYMCDICNKQFKYRSSLRSHIQYTHDTNPRHRCDICNKLFKIPRALREHMTMHTGEMLYSCPHCPRTFSSSANMHSHRKNKHPEEFVAARRNREKMKELLRKGLTGKSIVNDENVVEADFLMKCEPGEKIVQ